MDSSLLAVGFCQPCLNNDSSVSLAAKDAIWNILSQRTVMIKSRSGIAGSNPNIIFMGQDVAFEVDTAGYDRIVENYDILDKYFSGDMIMVLVGQKKDSILLKDDSKPYDYGDWLHDIPKDDQSYFALGSAPEYFYESSSWKEALNSALLELARQVSSKIRSLEKYDGQNVYKTIIEEGEVVLQNWQVVSRHYSPENKTCNILITMPRREEH